MTAKKCDKGRRYEIILNVIDGWHFMCQSQHFIPWSQKGNNDLDQFDPERVSDQQDRCSDDERLVGDVKADGDVDVEVVHVRHDVRAEATRNLVSISSTFYEQLLSQYIYADIHEAWHRASIVTSSWVHY